MNKCLVPLALLTVVPLTLHAQRIARYSYDVAFLGDMPYGTAREAAYQRAIDDVNSFGPQLVTHIGDTKSGSTLCDDAHYTKTFSLLNNFLAPVIYSVGDNEWTDCMRTNNGRFDPVNRLNLVRKTYFSNNLSLGRLATELIRQNETYPENAMLIKDPVVFLSVHTTGSNNNREYKTAQGAANPFYDNDQEYNGRNAADLAWLRAGFKAARDNRSLALVILTQANVFESFMSTSTGSTHSGFADLVTALRDETKRFEGEVYMVSGDSHYMRIDKPLTQNYPGCQSATGDCKPVDTPTESPGDRILNFTRIEVPGDGDVHWVLCHVQPIPGRVLACEFRIVGSNR
jgi:hypothetical protein